MQGVKNMQDINKMTDEEIVEKTRSENQELFAELIKRYEKKLSNYVRRFVYDEDRTDHIVQDVFIKAFVNLNGFNTNKKFSSWIYRIARNESLNEIKKNKKELKLPDDFDIEGPENIFDEYADKESSTEIQKSIRKLPLKYSEPLMLFYFENKSYNEVSEILRIPIGTVSIRIRRARELMKKYV